MKKHLLLTCLLFNAVEGVLSAEEAYIAPLANQVMFRLDKLPIDKGIRKEISRNLTILVKRKHDGSAFEQRLTAQTLMLAMRLDRKNNTAQSLNSNLLIGVKLPVTDIQVKMKAKDRLYHFVDVLAREEAGDEAHRLVNYLKDVLVHLDKDSPLKGEHVEQLDRWKGIVSAYAEKVPVVKEPDPEKVANALRIVEEPALDKIIEPDTKLDVKAKSYTKWTKQNSAISTILTIIRSNEEHHVTDKELVTMNSLISPRVKLDSELKLELKPWRGPDRIAQFKIKLMPLMKRQFENFESVKIEVTTEEKLSSKSDESILLPILLQLIASEQDIQIRDGMAVLAKLKGREIVRYPNFWKHLKLFRESGVSNQRLLIPSASAVDLKQLVALEEEDFFVRYEVLGVSKLDEAVDLLSNSQNSNIQEASEDFARIQDLIGTKSVGPFAVNKVLRGRLESILSKNPNHISARMILLRGEVSRSKTLDLYFVADELRPLLEQIAYINTKHVIDLSGQKLSSLAELIEVELEKLEPFLDSDGRELVGNIDEIAQIIAKMGRTKNKRASIAIERALAALHADFKRIYTKTKVSIDTTLRDFPTL